jgi:exonuclease SbcD
MRVLHTADWHLGRKLEQFDRTDEHQDFLDWLILTLTSEQIDVLIVAGDIFDSGSPSNTALEQYYRFLRQVKDTPCRDVVIIGGNHDSISTLNAPKELLKYFNVHIVGGVPDLFKDQVIPLYDQNNQLGLIVCAVPFLRDRDIRLSVSGETADEREARIKKGIIDHYQNLVEHITVHKENNIPVIATGHLFAAGASTSEGVKDIHVGNLGQVGGDQFPIEFNYIALGHLHRPQKVNKMDHVRYSGSPVPLTFSENDHRKVVILVNFMEDGTVMTTEVEVPCCRRLMRLSGTLDSIRSQVLLLEDEGLKYQPWVELKIDTNAFIPDLPEQLERLRAQRPFIGHFFPRQLLIRPARQLSELAEAAAALSDLDPKTVFIKKCESVYPGTDYGDLLSTFEEALEAMQQQEDQP